MEIAIDTQNNEFKYKVLNDKVPRNQLDAALRACLIKISPEPEKENPLIKKRSLFKRKQKQPAEPKPKIDWLSEDSDDYE